MLSCYQMPQPASDDLAEGAPMSPEVELIRALSEDLALEILASYAPASPTQTSLASERQRYTWPTTVRHPGSRSKS
jgi:hypothetical protein